MRWFPLIALAACQMAESEQKESGGDYLTDEDWNSTSTDWSDADTDADADADSDSDVDTTTSTPSGDTADTETDTGEPADACDSAQPEPVRMYMSADDSNSQGDATLTRALIEGGSTLRNTPRTYEFLNYYDFDYPPADAGAVAINAQARPGAEAGTYDVLIAVVGPAVDNENRDPLNLTFSNDTSGSMTGEGLETTKAVMRAAASSLREGDIVSIVTWSTENETVLDSHVVEGPDDDSLLDAITAMTSSGGTNLSAGLTAAYSLADANYQNGWTNRVVLISDGGANVGVTDEDLIGNRAEDSESEGIYLLGVGAGKETSFSDGLMDTVTDLGKGAYLYVDDATEAEKSFTGDRFIANLEIAARNVQLSVALPGNWVVSEFRGEEINTNPDEVRPQHLAPNDAMLYSMVLENCGDSATGEEVFDLEVTWEDPDSNTSMTTISTTTLGDMLDEANTEIEKAEAIVAYVEALAGVWDVADAERDAYLEGVIETVQAAAADRPGDADLTEIIALLQTYRGML